MTTRLAALVVLACTAGVFAGQPRLVNPKPVFAGSPPAYKRPNQYYLFAMRLSPDGKRVLYSRPVAGSEQADHRSGRFELVLRELGSGKDSVLPVEALDPGWRTVFTRFNLFDPAGKRLLAANIKVETVQVRAGGSQAKRPSIAWLIYDIARAKAAKVGIEGPRALARFTADGRGLIVSDADLKTRRLVTKAISLKDPSAKAKATGAPGYVQSICPTGDVAVFFVPPARPVRRSAPGQRRERPPMRLILWDLKADKELVQVPTHARNSVLDDMETQWTANGRYLYYWNFEVVARDGQSRRPRLRPVTRVWDRKAGKLVGTVGEAVSV